MNRINLKQLASDQQVFALWFLENFPESCPYGIEQIFDPEFLPGGM